MVSYSVSVIISAYNAEKYLSQTLDSVLNQTYSNLEIIVVNDGSTDSTLSVLETYSDKIKIITQVNKGQDAALNNGYKNCSGEFIKFMDSDDLINPEMIELQMKALEGSHNKIAYAEWGRFYHEDIHSVKFELFPDRKVMSPVDFLTSTPIGPMLQCGIMLVPRNLIEKSGLWDERLILFNDTEFYSRLLLNSEGVIFTSGAKLYYRSGLKSSISVQKSRKFFESTYLATNLVAENLLKFEDSKRTRNLIANIYFNQYFEMYPFFNDLQSMHIKKIKLNGGASIKPNGGLFFKIFSFVFGWRISKIIQIYAYKLGYQPNSF
jgi:glycosyltransferase involved in cell wall biosynthesis